MTFTDKELMDKMKQIPSSAAPRTGQVWEQIETLDNNIDTLCKAVINLDMKLGAVLSSAPDDEPHHVAPVIPTAELAEKIYTINDKCVSACDRLRIITERLEV